MTEMLYPRLEWILDSPALNLTELSFSPSVATDSQGNIILAYTTVGAASGGTYVGTGGDVVVAKINAQTREVMWLQQNSIFNTPGAENISILTFANSSIPASSIIIDSSDNIYLAYSVQGIVSGGTSTTFLNRTIALMKMRGSDGQVLWVDQKPSFSASSSNYFPSIAIDGTSIYLTFRGFGTLSGTQNVGSQDIIIVKFTDNGTTRTIDWIQRNSIFNTPDTDNSPRIVIDSLGFLYVTYITYGTVSGGTNAGESDIVIMKMNPTTGSVLWMKQNPTTFNTLYRDEVPSIVIDSSNNLYIMYNTDGTVSGGIHSGQIGVDTDIVLMKMNSDGDLQWLKQIPEINNTSKTVNLSYANSIVLYNDTLYITFTSFNDNVVAYISIAKMGSDGSFMWNYTLPRINSISDNSETGDRSTTLVVDNSGYIYVAYYNVYNFNLQEETNNSKVLIAKLLEIENGNEVFPIGGAGANSYLVTNGLTVYTKETVDALIAETPLPTNTHVSWAPAGVFAGTLLRDLKKSIIVSKNLLQRRKMVTRKKYVFRLIQLIQGAETEGIGGSSSDIEPYRCGYICTWSADGIPPVF